MQYVEPLNYENLTLKTEENILSPVLRYKKMAIFTVPTSVLLSYGKIEFSIQKFTSFSICKGSANE